MGLNQEMETRLQTLIRSNQPENRMKWLKEWKAQGKKVIGLMDIYVPEEVISAAGILPWRITGSWDDSDPHAALYRPEMSCRYCSHVLESVLSGTLDQLDGFVCIPVDDDFKRLWDVLHYLKKPPMTYIMYLPHSYSELTLGMWNKSILELKQVLEDWTGKTISDDALSEQIAIYNRMRGLLRQVYELRKRPVPALTGAEALGLVTAARIMPREEFSNELEALLPYLRERRGTFRDSSCRVLVCSEYLDNPAYVQLVEDCGAAVVMDEFDTGSKYFWGQVEVGSQNPWEALGKRYMDRPGTSRMENWTEQIGQIRDWVKEYNVRGIVELRQLYSLPLAYRFLIMKKELAAANIPYVSLDREYHLAQTGMLSTRVEAFLEMIKGG
ncbi:2-hydroxyacyl-CoA dehydratase subunit D [Papillibacter cinnamivorans]|uniref:Benzoyl-CoA reductase/2-hydroxyglutaryl-CoA dehydratase subunit, BcrC/BadD/HgdB n=1 Tax=Papillibacter cinnamivorans DSM 12816 TaxID=1122930 RepID=A0A1W2CBH4_9FIRM|nr:2-hydroxyacyl-CoA dehydratase family protein [Papillibacter cinnamivorans]SMC82625.1 Benzoyl-CoA reductase/2-hydroxyglutaryl-CoA dehydratase subunit, BcrC/BadD/HgdB [Papillibacter cinnamivorans DSM 12816]